MVKLFSKKRSKGWENREPEFNDEQHVLPIEDERSHLPEDCSCNPRTEVVPRDDGSYGWLVVHNSFDGREKYE